MAKQRQAGCGMTLLTAAILVGLVAWAFESCSSDLTPSPEEQARRNAEKEKEQAQREAERRKEREYGTKIGARIMAQDFVKERLVSPSSADFGGIFGGQSYSNCVTDLGEGRYRVRGWVDSDNRFGAKLRITFSGTLKYVGTNKWRCESMDMRER